MPLPLILAGPIVRRVEPRLAAFWLATSEACDVTATIWPGFQTVGSSAGTIAGPTNPWASSDPTPTRRIGGRLHVSVVVVEVAPENAAMIPGTVYSYNLKIERKNDSSHETDLGQERLLEDEANITDTSDNRIPGVHIDAPLNLALGYLSDRLPSFVTCPPTLDDLFLVQSGCRNNNVSEFDATAWIDELIDSTLR